MDIHKDIKQYETTHKQKLINLTFKGLPVWLNIRNHYFALKNKGFTATYQHQTLFDKIKYLRNVFYGLHELFLSPKSIWIITSSVNKRKLNGKYIDVFTEFVIREYNNDTLVWEMPVFTHKKKKDLTAKHIISTSSLLLVEQIVKLFFVRKKEIEETTDYLHEFIEKDILEKIPLSHSVTKIYLQYKVMRVLLKILKPPKAVFIVASYTNYGYIKALKEKGVKVVEIQHGIINKHHYGYNLFLKYPNSYFPDYLLTFGKNEISVFQDNENQWGRKLTRIVPVGNFMIDYYLKNFSPDKKIQTLKKNYQLTFAVALQDCEIGKEFFQILIAIAKELPHVLFLTKRRKIPMEWYENNYSWTKNIVFIEDIDVYNVILHSDYHITAYSSTAIEAPAMGKINLLCNIHNKAKTYYESRLNEKSDTFYFNTPNEFINILPNLPEKSSKEIQQQQTNILPEYHKNIKSFLLDLKNEVNFLS